MKKRVVFIDNDDLKMAEETIKVHVLPALNTAGLFIEFDDVTIVPDFQHRTSDENYELLFDPNNVIVTWSMLTAGGSVSLQQFRHFIRAAGRYDKKNLTYIDTASYLQKVCEDTISDDSQRNLANFMKGIANNNIYHCYDGCRRLSIDFGEPLFVKAEDADLSHLNS